MVVGCYTMDLYCDYTGPCRWSDFPSQYTGRTESECLRGARLDGWRFHGRPKLARCPKCVRSGNLKRRESS